MKISIQKNSFMRKLLLPILLTALFVIPAESDQPESAPENKDFQGPIDSPLVVSFGDKNKNNVKVIMYHALNCPHCKEFKQNIFPTFKKKYIDTGIIYFEMRDFPIDALSMAAAKLAWCKESTPESYQKYSKVITDNFRIDEGAKVDVDWANVETTNVAIERLVDLMGKHGVTPEECATCLKEKTAAENHILQSCLDVQNLTNGKLDYAPGFLVNGVLVELPDLEKEIAKNRDGKD